MTKNLIEYRLKDSTESILIEADSEFSHEKWEPAGGARELIIDNTIAKAVPTINNIIDIIRKIGNVNDEVEIEFGIGFNASSQVFIAQAGSDVNIAIRIKLAK
jgi:hypothetical protein